MRSLKNDYSSIIAGMQIHHNFICEHMGLEGKTFAKASGVKVEVTKGSRGFRILGPPNSPEENRSHNLSKPNRNKIYLK